MSDKTKYKKAQQIFSDENHPDIAYSYGDTEVEFSGENFDIRLSDENYGNPGMDYQNGYANNKDKNKYFLPYRARGKGRDFGLYHQTFLSSQSYQDAWGKIEQGLITSHWFVDAPKCEDPNIQTIANKQAKLVANILFGIEGGWSKHITEALYFLVAGFSPFIRIINGKGELVALSFRYPSQVNKWLTD